MKIFTIIKNWALGAGRNSHHIRVTRLNQDHTLEARYPDVVPTVYLELTLEADARGRRPQLRIWIPLARRTPLFVFGPDAARPGEVDIEATFPSFENADELVGALDKVRSDFLSHYCLRRSRRVPRTTTLTAVDVKR